MTKGWKIGLSSVGMLGLCLVSGVIGISYWLKTNGKQYLEQQMNKVRTNEAEGKKYGATADQLGCLKEALLKLDDISSKDLSGLVANRLFFRNCLQTSNATPNFCDGLPAKENGFASARWRIEKCQELKSKHQQCHNLLGDMQSYCAKEKSPREIGSESQPQPND